MPPVNEVARGLVGCLLVVQAEGPGLRPLYPLAEGEDGDAQLPQGLPVQGGAEEDEGLYPVGLQKLQGLQLPHQAPVAGHGDGAVGGGLQLQGEGLEDGAEEGAGEVREEDAHGVGTPRGQALGQGLGA